MQEPRNAEPIDVVVARIPGSDVVAPAIENVVERRRRRLPDELHVGRTKPRPKAIDDVPEHAREALRIFVATVPRPVELVADAEEHAARNVSEQVAKVVDFGVVVTGDDGVNGTGVCAFREVEADGQVLCAEHGRGAMGVDGPGSPGMLQLHRLPKLVEAEAAEAAGPGPQVVERQVCGHAIGRRAAVALDVSPNRAQVLPDEEQPWLVTEAKRCRQRRRDQRASAQGLAPQGRPRRHRGLMKSSHPKSLATDARPVECRNSRNWYATIMKTHLPASERCMGRIAAGAATAVLLAACGGQGEAGASSGGATSSIVPAPAYQEPYGSPGARAAHAAAVALREALGEHTDALVLPIDSPLRSNWSNLPAGMVSFDHNGVRIGDLTAEQTGRVHDFLAAALGPHGYKTVTEVVAGEAMLAQSIWARFGSLSEQNYWLAFFGEPSATGAWGWQFGGHHLAVNGSFADGRTTSLSPTFLGAEPAVFAVAGVDAAPLSEELEAARALMRALPAELRAEATIGPSRMQAGAGRDGLIPELRGSAVATWPDDARSRLLETIHHWVALQPPEHATSRMAELEEAVSDLHFAWSGSIDEDDDETYFHIQGPTLIIEFTIEDTGEGGHFHSVYRDPTNEYGSGSRALQGQRPPPDNALREAASP